MADGEKPKYPVGYANPPRSTQFRTGTSGNPKGRPKSSKNFSTLFEEELDARVPVTENGKRKKITKRRAAVKQIVNKAAGGDVKALGTILNEFRLRDGLLGSSDVREILDSAPDEQVIAGILDRMRRKVLDENHKTPEATERSSSTDIKDVNNDTHDP